MKKKIIGIFVVTLLIATAIPVIGQVKNISISKDNDEINPLSDGDKWMKTYDFSMYDSGESVQQTSDGGYIVAGSKTPLFGLNYDIFLLKTDSMGNKIWEKTFGEENWDKAVSIKETSDGGYIIIGYTASYSIEDHDFWLIKTDSQGNMVWDKKFGSSEYNETGLDVIEISNGGFIIVGIKRLFGDWKNPSNIWLIKTDSDGNMIWNKTFSKEDKECSGRSIQELDDGGYIIVGSISAVGIPSYSDIYLLRTDSEGELLWDKTFDKNKYEYGMLLQKTSDGGIIILGNTHEKDPLWYDVWLLKTDGEGELLWDKTYGGNGNDWGNSLQKTSDGGYVIAGYMDKFLSTDGFLIKTNSVGEKEWIKIYDKSRVDIINSVQQTTDGGYILTGCVDAIFILNTDLWLVKTDANGNVARNRGVYNPLLLRFLEQFPLLQKILVFIL